MVVPNFACVILPESLRVRDFCQFEKNAKILHAKGALKYVRIRFTIKLPVKKGFHEEQCPL